MNKINYPFVAVPSKFLSICDNYTFKLLSFFIFKHNYFKKNNKLDFDGYFFVPNKELQQILNTSNKEVIYTVEALYQHKLIDVQCSTFDEKKRKTNRYKINFEVVEQLANTQDDIKIEKCKRNTPLTYTMAKCHQNKSETMADCHTTLYKNNLIISQEQQEIEELYRKELEECNEIFNELNKEFEEYNENITIDTTSKDIQQFITDVFNSLKDHLNKIYECKNKESFDYYCGKVEDVLTKCMGKENIFSDAQWEYVRSFASRFIKLCESKQNYFNKFNKQVHPL